MKIEYFILLFIISFLVISSIYDTKQDNLEKISIQKERYDMILESAADDAAECMVDIDGGGNLTIQKDRALDVFFRSLYAGFHVMDDKQAQEEIRRYIPLIMIMDKDGVYYWYHGTYEKNGKNYAERWSEKYPYSNSYQEDGNTYYLAYTMEDTASILDSETYYKQYGTRKSLEANYPGLDFLQEDLFQDDKRSSIVNTITDGMTYYINHYNRIGLQNGLEYHFAIPYLSNEDWNRTIDDISFLVIFQGYPYGNYTTERYNQFEVSCARTKKIDKYYITSTNGILNYHKADCIHVDMDTMQPYDSKRECAKLKAFPCKECNP